MVTTASLEMQRHVTHTTSKMDATADKSALNNKTVFISSEQGMDSPNPRKRTRKAHNKVRTGCLTCKIRRKKCDETRPACVRCTSTGRKCDGYTEQVSATKKSLMASSNSATISPRQPAVDTLTSIRPHDRIQPSQPRQTILPKTTPNASSQNPSEHISDLQWNDGFSPTSITLTDSAYGTVDGESEKSEEEELEDFILSYRKPVSSLDVSSAIETVRETSTTHSAKQTTVPHQPPSSLIIFGKPTISRSLFPYSGQVSEIERHCFTYFRYRTGPSFSSYFDSSMWRTYAISAALAHPVVLSSAAACGAAHRRWGFGISREAFEYCAHANKLHKKAIRGLEELKREFEEYPDRTGTYDRDVIMTSEMLLGMFEGFQGEYQKTVTHMNSGIKHLLSRPMTLVHSESRYCAIASKPTMFCQLFDQLHFRATELFKTSATLLVKYGEGESLPIIPTVFTSLDQARDLIFTEVDWIMHAPASVWLDTQQRSDIQDLHVRRLLNWSVAYANTIQNLQRSPQQKKACTLLKIVRNAAYLLLYLTLFVTADQSLSQISDFDIAIPDDLQQEGCLAFASKKLWNIVERREELNINLERVKLVVEDILDDNGIFNYDEHSVSFDSAIGPPKYPTSEKIAVPEASEKTRHLVKRLMQKKPDDCSLWEMLGVYGVAERISAVEEHAVMDAVRGIIPESVDPKWVDVTCLMENRRILLKYCRPDDYGLGMMWTQEWWSF